MKEWHDFGIDIAKAKGAGIDKRMPCPECSPYRKKSNYPCLSVNVDEGIWNCFHCGWAGTLKRGQDRASLPYAPEKHYRKPVYRATTLSARIVEWFAKRGIPEQVLARNRISYGSVYFPQTENEEPAIQFPYFRDGEVINVKYRGREKTFRMETGAERILYGFDDIQDDSVIFTEGEIDKLSLEVVGFTSVVSVPDGAPTPNTKNYSSKFDFLLSAEKKLNAVGKVIIAVDTDAPGQHLAEELARRIGPEKCWRVQWPDGCKDANDVLVSHGQDELRLCIEKAMPWPVRGIVEITQVLPAVDLLFTEGIKPGLSPGWQAVARYYRPRTGEITIVTGVPSHGKSQFVNSLAVNLALAHDWRIATFSPEHYPLERYVAMLLELRVGKPFSEPQGHMSYAELDTGIGWLHEHFSFIMPEEDQEATIENLLTLARVLVYRKGINGLILDPWNEIDHQRPPAMTETEYVSLSLSQLRRFSRQHNVHVWLIAHPTKLQKAQKGRYEGKYAPPTPYDISGSAHFRNKADNCLTVWRDVEIGTNEVEIHITKVRYRENGKPGVAVIGFDESCGRYVDLPEHETEPYYA